MFVLRDVRVASHRLLTLPAFFMAAVVSQSLIAATPGSLNAVDNSSTHSLCVMGNQGLQHAQAVNGPATLTAVDSLTKANADFMAIVVKSLHDRFAAGDLTVIEDMSVASSASMAMASPQLTTAFSGLMLQNYCSADEFAVSGCATRITPAAMPGAADARYQRLNTKVDDGSYVRRIEAGPTEQGPWQEEYRIEGKVGDLGTISFIFSDAKGGERFDYQRSESGEESVRLTSESTNFYIQETSHCHGRLDYDSRTEDEHITLKSAWQFNGGKTTGQLSYRQVSLADGEVVERSFRW
ncbi:hypothetical protein ABC502_12720 [Alkalimonas sp. NCh-2]|uniref:hypothetical protein n=1 Tax=Alkalimonas sp. NCh-2 TaxID=3144846 RepID=UPI0031F6A203